jgi:predicted AlkP superfamily pyrophosphatase or phosphodiesterase
LTRIALELRSDNKHSPSPYYDRYTKIIQCNADPAYWFPSHKCVKTSTPVYSRIIFFIIDALRFDMAQRSTSDFHYSNKLTLLDQVANTHPDRTRLYRFVADAPTTTSQRLKGLMTGGLPTFIDMGKNFDSDEVQEDSLILQLSASNRTVVAMGDDTWSSLFPTSNNYYKRHYFFPSFDVMDLHTVDNGILAHLDQEMSEKDTQLLITHFLGVDHAGHRHGAHHSEMSVKLTQMNNVLSHLMKDFDANNTLFVVFGDHGMNDHGDHGGDSPIEVNAALWVHSPNSLYSIRDTRNQIVDIPQIDFVPTIARLMGVAIPFGNLGALITDMIPFQDEFEVLTSLHVNAWQVHKYLQAYTEHDKTFITDQHMQEIHKDFHKGNDQFVKLLEKISTTSVEDILKNYIEIVKNTSQSYEQYIQETARICRNMWAKFDVQRMIIGLCIVGAVLLTIVAHLVLNVEQSSASTHQWIAIISLMVYAASKVAVLLTGTSYTIPDSFIVGVIGTTIVSYWWQSILPNLYMFALSYDLIDIFNIVCLVLYLLSIFSNSFIVYEDRIVYFIVITNGLLMAYQATKTNKKLVLFIMLYFACIRLSSFTIRYRTHGTHHMESVQDSELDLISRYGMYALPALLPLIALSIYDSRSKWIVWIYYPIQLSLIFSFWYARDSTLSTVSEEQPAYLVNLPRVVYAIWIVSVLYVLLRREANRWYIHLFAITYAPLLMLKGLNYSSTFALMFTQTILLAYIVNNLKIGTITTVWGRVITHGYRVNSTFNPAYNHHTIWHVFLMNETGTKSFLVIRGVKRRSTVLPQESVNQRDKFFLTWIQTKTWESGGRRNKQKSLSRSIKL